MTASGIILALLAFAAWRDIATRTIPDSISIAILLVGAITRLSVGWQPLGISVAVALAVFCLLIPFQARGLVGGADLKLMAALALGLSPLGSYQLVTAVTLLGGLLAAFYLGLRHILARVGTAPAPLGRRRGGIARRVAVIESWRIRRNAPLPYGIAIAAGAAVVVLGHPGV